MGRMNRIRKIDPDNFTITVDAGCIIQNIQNAAKEANRLFPLQLASEGSCQIGGTIATNAGGILTLRYGNMRDLVLGLEVVMPDGRIWNGLRALRKDNTGYDLKHLFIGAEGSLGIVTGAVLKLFPLPTDRETFFISLPVIDDLPKLYGLARSILGDVLSAFELIPHQAIQWAQEKNIPCVDPLPRAGTWLLLAEVTSTAASTTTQSLRMRAESFLEQALENKWIDDGTIAESEAQRADLWRMRETIVDVQRHVGMILKHDISVPIADIPRFITQGTALVLQKMPGIRPIFFGHAGDGNLHFNCVQPEAMTVHDFKAQMKAVERAVHDLVVEEYHGSISAEHGIGRFKRDELAMRKSAVEMDMMRAVKQALDPHNIMNPGSVL
jgi:D-lactate dehydrogenase (cytochrome)